MAMKSDWDTEPDDWQTEEGFDLASILNGVDKGKRHNSLYQYVGWLISQGKSKQDIEDIILEWNEKNRPPIPTDELMLELDWCWSEWAKGK